MIHQEDQLLQTRMAEMEKELAVATRKLEIEVALGKVRSRRMAMQRSDELLEVLTAVRKKPFDVQLVRNVVVTLFTFEGYRSASHWIAHQEKRKGQFCGFIFRLPVQDRNQVFSNQSLL